MNSRLIRTTTLAIPVMLLALAGCGSDGDNTEPDATTEASADATATTDAEEAATTEPSPDTSASTTEAMPSTEAPATTTQLDAVELLSSMGLVGSDYGADYTVAVDVADLSTANAVAGREAAESTAECEPPTVEAPLPYSTLTSGARIDFINSIGATSSAHLIVMPMEAAAIGYLEALRNDEQIPTCIGVATLKSLTGAPEGITMDMENYRFDDPVAGYGDDQVRTGSDLVISQDGTVLLTVPGGSRYTRIGNVILVVGGTSPDADNFAPTFYDRAIGAIEAA